MHFHSVLLGLLLDLSIRPPKESQKGMVSFAYNEQVKHLLHIASNSVRISSESAEYTVKLLARSGPLSSSSFKEVPLHLAEESNTTLVLFFFG